MKAAGKHGIDFLKIYMQYMLYLYVIIDGSLEPRKSEGNEFSFFHILSVCKLWGPKIKPMNQHRKK